MTLKDLITEIIQHNRRNEVNKIFMVAWAIWNNMNDVVWNQKGMEYTEILTSVIQILNNREFA